MTDRQGECVFLSYNRRDRMIVELCEQVLRAGGVIGWRDTVSLKPGSRWWEEIEGAIARCDRMLVFWCRHSRRSSWVQTEYELALEQDKHVIPIRLDDSELTAPLASRTEVDISEKIRSAHRWSGYEVALWVYAVVVTLAVLFWISQ